MTGGDVVTGEIIKVFRTRMSAHMRLFSIDLFTRLLLLPPILLTAACNGGRDPSGGTDSRMSRVTTESGLIYEVVEAGSGPIAEAGQLALIHEVTKLADGTVIADTYQLNQPIQFLLGGKQVIDGMDEAVTGMRVGERRYLTVPPSLSRRSSYPEDGSYGPDDTLYYDVILLQVTNPDR
jgi:FKBP-type peptidyl-prolyl cis-trans isomerase FkpA